MAALAPHGPLFPRARHHPRQAGPHEASTRHPRCLAVFALCAQPGTRSAGEGLFARCTQPRRPRAGAACCGEARKVGCGEARAAAHNARSIWERRPDLRRSTSAEREVAVCLGQLTLAAPRR
ncbi:hypothetical protein T492DRAFT_987659 [Pavlovales sp. CCMP2436]|nr:hypothetical protein T492DRAFT_987659 [Pavlovales sp. CCMP2436]